MQEQLPHVPSHPSGPADFPIDHITPINAKHTQTRSAIGGCFACRLRCSELRGFAVLEKRCRQAGGRENVDCTLLRPDSWITPQMGGRKWDQVLHGGGQVMSTMKSPNRRSCPLSRFRCDALFHREVGRLGSAKSSLVDQALSPMFLFTFRSYSWLPILLFRCS